MTVMTFEAVLLRPFARVRRVGVGRQMTALAYYTLRGGRSLRGSRREGGEAKRATLNKRRRACGYMWQSHNGSH